MHRVNFIEKLIYHFKQFTQIFLKGPIGQPGPQGPPGPFGERGNFSDISVNVIHILEIN